MTDTDKLNLILEHAKEYYRNERAYAFIEGGFISYELFDTEDGEAIYFSDIFVSKAARGSKVFGEIVTLGETIAHHNNVDVAYCRVEKDNKHIDTLQAMYAGFGFKEHSEDTEAIYYKWSRE